VRLPAFAAERNLLLCIMLWRHCCWPQRRPLSIDISCRHGTQQQTRRSDVQMMGQTDRQIDSRHFHRPCFAYYASDVNKYQQAGNSRSAVVGATSSVVRSRGGSRRYCGGASVSSVSKLTSGKSRRGKVRGVPGSRSLHSALDNCDDHQLVDFVARCLDWDPAARLTPPGAIQHAWFKRRQDPAAPAEHLLAGHRPSVTLKKLTVVHDAAAAGDGAGKSHAFHSHRLPQI